MSEKEYEPAGFIYRHDERESWSFAPLDDELSMERLAEHGWQVEKLYRETAHPTVEGENET